MLHLDAINCQTHDHATPRPCFHATGREPKAADVPAAYDRAFTEEGGEVQPLYRYGAPSCAFGVLGATLPPEWKRIRAALDAIAPAFTPTPTPVPTPTEAPSRHQLQHRRRLILCPRQHWPRSR